MDFIENHDLIYCSVYATRHSIFPLHYRAKQFHLINKLTRWDHWQILTNTSLTLLGKITGVWRKILTQVKLALYLLFSLNWWLSFAIISGGYVSFQNLSLNCCVGVPALTSRNFKESDFVEVINFLDRGIDIAVDAKKKTSKGRD